MSQPFEDELVVRYRRLRAWVLRERKRLAKTRERPTQRLLRRARLLDEVSVATLRELINELKAFP